jgi:RimJ/RimL family protein N-acetyltransferase
VSDEPGQEIVTHRLLLTRIVDGDTADLVTMLGKPELHEYIGGVPLTPLDATKRVQRWIRGSANPDIRWINYVARRGRDGGFVGLAQATVTRTPRTGHTRCELAYLVDPPAQHQGFGTEMMRGFHAELRDTLRPAEFTANIFPGHTASEGVAKAVGLTPTTELVDGERVWRD